MTFKGEIQGGNPQEIRSDGGPRGCLECIVGFRYSRTVDSADTSALVSLNTPGTIRVRRRNVIWVQPRTVKQARHRPGSITHFHDDHVRCLTPAEVQMNGETHFSDFITSIDEPRFECRNRQSHRALIAVCLADLFDLHFAQ